MHNTISDQQMNCYALNHFEKLTKFNKKHQLQIIQFNKKPTAKTAGCTWRGNSKAAI